jgi:glycosyltransferase involved in cell wall biosynthesis
MLRERARVDVIAVSGFRLLGMPALVAGRLTGTPCILKADSLGEMSGAYFAGGLAQLGLRPSSPPFRLFLALRNALFRRADAFVAISSEIAEELEACGVDPSRIHRIPNGVDTERFRPAPPELQAQRRAQLGLPEGGRVVAYVGRLVRYKGLPVLLDAWRSLASSRPGCVLVLAGAGGRDLHDCEAELRDFVRRHALGERVRFAGEVADVAALLQAADAFAFPTENEAFGIALVEAMACGLPVVSTAVGGLRDLVRDGDNALVVPPGDAPALARTLDRLLADADLRERLGRRARRDAVERYGIAGVVDRWASLAAGLLDPQSPAGASSRVASRRAREDGRSPAP